ncbi:hypothetical protein Tco_0666068 [Tanacetum coccineum]
MDVPRTTYDIRKKICLHIVLRMKFYKILSRILPQGPSIDKAIRLLMLLESQALLPRTSGAHFGYNCPPKDPIISELEPCYNRNFDYSPHDSQTLPQQYLCCENCGGPHETYQCQPMNQEYFYSHSSGFDQFQPPQFSDVYQTPPVASMEMLHAQTDLIESMQNFLKKYDHIPHNEKSIKLLLAEEKFLKIKQVVEEEQTQPEYLQELLQSLLKDLQILNEIQPLKQETPNQIQKDQEEKSIAELLAEERLQKANQALNESQSPQEMRIQDLEIQKQQCLEEMKEWMNDLGIREIRKEEIDIDYRRKCEDKIYELKDKFNGLSIEIRKIIQEAEELRESEARARIQKIIIDDDDDDLGFYADELFNTTPETETISVETLVSNPSESEGLSDNESECDMPVCDVSSPIFTVFSNPLFDSNDNFSSDDESVSEEEIQKDEFNSFSNPLYDIDDEIITNESNLLSKKDLDEIILIPPGIDEPCFNAESDLLESLLNRDSPIDSTKTDSIFDEFSFLPEEHNSENVNTIIESLSYSPIPVEDSDSLIEEIDLFLTSDDSMPPGIESDDYDSEGDFRENVVSLNVEEERIEKTKRSKNSQKPTRNERDKNKSEESAKDQSRISPTQQERQSKVKGIKLRTISDKSSKFKSSFGVIKFKGLKLQKWKDVY